MNRSRYGSDHIDQTPPKIFGEVLSPLKDKINDIFLKHTQPVKIKEGKSEVLIYDVGMKTFLVMLPKSIEISEVKDLSERYMIEGNTSTTQWPEYVTSLSDPSRFVEVEYQGQTFLIAQAMCSPEGPTDSLKYKGVILNIAGVLDIINKKSRPSSGLSSRKKQTQQELQKALKDTKH